MAEADEKYDGIDYEAHIQKQRHRGLQRRMLLVEQEGARQGQ